jgi:glutathione S-transferase
MIESDIFVQYSTKTNFTQRQKGMNMQLYFSPMACSLATRISLYEAGAQVDYIQVDTKTKRMEDGADFFAISPLGQVPTLRTDDGTLLTENTAILPYVASCYPGAGLAPDSGVQRAQLQQWLGFISTELHKAVFVPLLDPKAHPEVKEYAHAKVDLRMNRLQQHLAEREYLLDRFSVGDAYLVTILNWARYCGLDLAPWPVVQAYYERHLQRPSIARAVQEEFALYKEELAKQAKAA